MAHDGHHHHGPGHNHPHPDPLGSHLHDPDAAAELQVLTAQFIDGFREARDKSGRLLHISALEGRSLVAHLPVIDLRTGTVGRIGDLFGNVA